MSFPEPHPGLVIRYAYLWKHESDEGREEGSKDRPCAIVLSIVNEDDEREVLVLPITHTTPQHAVRWTQCQPLFPMPLGAVMVAAAAVLSLDSFAEVLL